MIVSLLCTNNRIREESSNETVLYVRMSRFCVYYVADD